MAGDLDIQDESGFEQRQTVADMIIHPNYTGTNYNFQNDICILRLLTPMRLNSMIKEIPITTESQAGTRCIISGWGSKEVNIFHSDRYFKDNSLNFHEYVWYDLQQNYPF